MKITLSYNGLKTLLKWLSLRYLRIGLSTKLLISYVPLATLLIVMSVYTLLSFKQLNAINDEVINKYLAVMEMTDELENSLMGQERFGLRYIILKKSDSLETFWKKSEEFKDIAKGVDAVFPDINITLLHANYEKSFMEWFDAVAKNPNAPVKTYEEKVGQNRGNVLNAIKKSHELATRKQTEQIARMSAISNNSFYFTVILCVLGLVFGIGAANLIRINVSASFKKLQQATAMVSEGKFSGLPTLSSDDEFGKLSEAFLEMGKKLKTQEELNLDASPLTRLPGGMAIENTLKNKLKYKESFSFCYFDIDNFKAYNDKYGYAKGSDLIVALANVICTAVRNHGSKEDFVGHIGGDDFVMVTVPEKHDTLCQKIIEDFDALIPSFYTADDVAKGYITAMSRQGVLMNFPLTTISISVVTNAHRTFTHPLEVGEVAAELKKLAKSKSKSNYVVDKRTRDRRNVEQRPKS